MRHRFIETNAIRMHVAEEGAGHWIQQERPQAVNDLLVEFLQGLS
jgi:pimeloyl-ACP methyl ester carboxylesterase